jgi:hypothetical protein
VSKLAAAVVLAGAGAVLPILRAAAAPTPSRDLWVGVLQHSILVPAAALVSGSWWYETNDGSSANLLTERVGRMPARWLPTGRLPTSWQAYQFNGGARWLRTVGSLFKRDAADTFGIHTDLPVVSLSAGDWEEQATGVAIAGAATVRLFKPVDGSHAELWRFAAAAIVAAQRASIKEYLQTPDGPDMAKLLPSPADPISGIKPLEDTHLVSSRLSDGADIYFLDGMNTISEKAGDLTCFLRVNVAVRRDPSGTLSMVGASAWPWCQEIEVTYRPLAILERGGVSCWLTELQFEDGVEYRLTKPAHAVFEAYASECALR